MGTEQGWCGVPRPPPARAPHSLAQASQAWEHDGHGSAVGQADHGSRGIVGLGASWVREHRGCRSTAGAGAWQDGTQRHEHQGCSAVWLRGLPQPCTGSGMAAADRL